MKRPKNTMMEEENSTKKDNQSQISLEKVIKLDCRDSNFLYRDQCRNRYFRVHYPHTNTDLSPGEHLLKKFWWHIESHYFKKLQREELNRLDYVKQIFNTSFENDKSRFLDQEFWTILEETFSTEVFTSLMGGQKVNLDRQNLLNRLYLVWKRCSNDCGIKQKRMLNKKIRESLQMLEKMRGKGKLKKSLEIQNKLLNQIISSQIISKGFKQKENQIQNQIKKLNNQLNDISTGNISILQKLQTTIQKELLFLQKSDKNEIQKQKNNCNLRNISKSKKNKKSQIETVPEEKAKHLDLNQIKFIVKNLQERQLAESMSKILECRKINSQYHYLISFETAMHVQPKLFTQAQFLKLNKLRETSLFQFYRTGVKCIYSYTNQSYVGFGELTRNRQNLGKYQQKDVFQMMKKTSQLAPQLLDTFSKFHTCHQCRFLYPQYMMKTCKFTSDRQILPKNHYQATLDPQFSEIFHLPTQTQCKGRISQRFTTRKRNCLTSYAKINQEYVCARKYCFSCLKDCYPNDIMNDSIFCPFCQGNCTCSRCLRNQKIIKFRNAFTLLGGDFIDLSTQSPLQNLQYKQQALMPRRRGRPKKPGKRSHITINRVQKKKRLGKGNKGSKNLLQNLGINQRRITFSNKKDKNFKKRLIMRHKSSTLLFPRRKRGRPPKSKQQFTKKFDKLLRNQANHQQIENIFLSMSTK